MANSGTVSAGSAALASQYNNLRDDVLNVSTGHKHTGAAEDGAQIEGTALKSTGATPGNVLIAGTGGTATTWGTFPGPSIVTSNATAVFTSNDFVNQWVIGAASQAQRLGVSGQGTVVTLSNSASATSRAVRTFEISTLLSGTVSGSVAAFATATINPVVAGTVGLSNFQPLDTYFSTQSASTALFFYERVNATTTGNQTLSLRKYDRALTSNIFNATLVSGASGTAALLSLFVNKVQHVPSADAFLGMYENSDTPSKSTVWSVNATSGSVYSAPIGTGTFVAGTLSFVPKQIVHVPGLSGADGTVHVFGTGLVGAIPRALRQEFVLGSASLTAGTIQQLSDFAFGFGPSVERGSTAQFSVPAIYEPVYGVYWDKNAEAIVMQAKSRRSAIDYPIFIGYDRNFSNVLFRSSRYFDNASGEFFNTVYPGDGFYRFTESGKYFLTGYANDYYAPQYVLGSATVGGDAQSRLIGNGTPTHTIQGPLGTAFIQTVNRYQSAEFPILGTASAARLVSAQNTTVSEFRIVSIRGTGITKFNDASAMESNTQENAGGANFPMIAEASGSVTVVMRPADETNESYANGTVVFPVTEIRLG